MKKSLEGHKVAVLATDGFDQREFDEPVKALRDAGATVEILALEDGTIKGVKGGKDSEPVKVDKRVSVAKAADYSALVLPGGVKNPDTLRQDADAVRFASTMLEMNKPVAAICHAAWLLVETGLVRGRTLTSYPSLRTDLENAGANWVDREVSLDERLLTSRDPGDLPAFCEALVSLISDSIDERKLDSMVEQSFPASDPLPASTTIASSGPENERPSEAR